MLPVGRQLADEVVVADVQTAVTSTGQCNWSHQPRLVDASVAASTVHAPSSTVTQHRRHSAWPLLQVDVRAVALV